MQLYRRTVTDTFSTSPIIWASSHDSEHLAQYGGTLWILEVDIPPELKESYLEWEDVEDWLVPIYGWGFTEMWTLENGDWESWYSIHPRLIKDYWIELPF